jgi:hypothetical protein
MGVYPFMFGTTKDFEPIVNELVEVQSALTSAREPVLMAT